MNNILVNRINKDITLESLENNLYEIDDNINVVVNIDKVCVNIFFLIIFQFSEYLFSKSFLLILSK